MVSDLEVEVGAFRKCHSKTDVQMHKRRVVGCGVDSALARCGWGEMALTLKIGESECAQALNGGQGGLTFRNPLHDSLSCSLSVSQAQLIYTPVEEGMFRVAQGKCQDSEQLLLAAVVKRGEVSSIEQPERLHVAVSKIGVDDIDKYISWRHKTMGCQCMASL